MKEDGQPEFVNLGQVRMTEHKVARPEWKGVTITIGEWEIDITLACEKGKEDGHHLMVDTDHKGRMVAGLNAIDARE